MVKGRRFGTLGNSLILVLAATLGFGALSMATSSGVIDGCYGNTTGILRVLSSGDTCRSSETSISWNQQGPAGPQGATGPQGPAGGLSGWEEITQETSSNSDVVKQLNTLCTPGKTVVSGGYSYNVTGGTVDLVGARTKIIVDESISYHGSDHSQDGWTVQAISSDPNLIWSLDVKAICVNSAP